AVAGHPRVEGETERAEERRAAVDVRDGQVDEQQAAGVGGSGHDMVSDRRADGVRPGRPARPAGIIGRAGSRPDYAGPDDATSARQENRSAIGRSGSCVPNGYPPVGANVYWSTLAGSTGRAGASPGTTGPGSHNFRDDRPCTASTASPACRSTVAAASCSAR